MICTTLQPSCTGHVQALFLLCIDGPNKTLTVLSHTSLSFLVLTAVPHSFRAQKISQQGSITCVLCQIVSTPIGALQVALQLQPSCP